MNRIENTFATLKQNNAKALVGFVTAGDPNVDASLELIAAMCDAGLDILELGVPFSDPTADGPVIQRSSARALAAGVTLTNVLEMTRKIREITPIPIILFSYYNPILAFGVKDFHAAARTAGADGVLVVDLPPEDSAELTDCGARNPLPMIRLIAPTTPKERVARIAATAAGFLYLVSKTGVTGSDGLDTSRIHTSVAMVRSVTDLPLCVGFGISTAEDVATIAQVADGIVIGSAFERVIEENQTDPNLPAILAENVRQLKEATN